MGWLGGLAFLTVIPMLFAQCETDLNNLDQAQAAGMPLGLVDATFGGGNVTDLCECLTTKYPVEELSAEEIHALTYMREEEKLARDIYLGMYDLWKVPVFNNISKAEQRHMDAVGCLLQKYQLTDPVSQNGIGVFQDADLQTLYNNLLAQGNTSLQAAYTVGATIEDLDIHDLLAHLDEPAVDNQDVVAVFGELNKGSRNHMRAFSGRLEGLGVTYVPQYITAEFYQTIITTDWERGGSACSPCPGQGPGNGQGNGPGGNGPGHGYGGNCPYLNNGNGPGGNGPGNGPGNGGGNGRGGRR